MRRYLIVDDNVAFAENLAEILRDQGAEVSVASGGHQALAQLKATRFDAMLTDMRMPSMGGAELVHLLRRVDPGLPVLVATAYSGDDDLRLARSEGLLAVLAKPIKLEHMSGLLEAARRDGLVALIEDDEALSDNLSETLRWRGFTAVTAASVVETERLGPVRPFAALVDLRAPGGPDGEAMRKLALKFPGIPMLVVTAHTNAPPPVPYEKLFLKPFDSQSLLAEVERLYSARGGAG
jgi:two-component system, response regulator PdtaR